MPGYNYHMESPLQNPGYTFSGRLTGVIPIELLPFMYNRVDSDITVCLSKDNAPDLRVAHNSNPVSLTCLS